MVSRSRFSSREILRTLSPAINRLTLAVSAGLGALLTVSRIAYNSLRFAGACYLIYL
jgi:hypothetical protein